MNFIVKILVWGDIIVNVTGVVLAGGRSTRMQSNKAFIEINGKRIIDNVLGKLTAELDEVIIVTNEPQEYVKYSNDKVRVVTDIIPGKGPLSGVHSGLIHTSNNIILTVACDMPFLNMDMAKYMIEVAGESDVVVPIIGNNMEPLFAVYQRKCLQVIERELKQGHLKISRVYELLDILYIQEETIKKFGDPNVLFYNVNNRDDLRKAQEMARRVI